MEMHTGISRPFSSEASMSAPARPHYGGQKRARVDTRQSAPETKIFIGKLPFKLDEEEVEKVKKLRAPKLFCFSLHVEAGDLNLYASSQMNNVRTNVI